MEEPNTFAPALELARLARDYRHVREEHERERAGGTTRRRLERELGELGERFELWLAHWVQDEVEQEAWRAHCYHGAARPEGPRLHAPPLFRGITSRDAAVELRPSSDGGYELWLDGALAEHHQLPWHLDPEQREPIHIGPWSCIERFAASADAVSALESFMTTPGATPPWRWAPELYEDGLVDADFALTPRGARRISSLRDRAAPPRPGADVCLLVADAARARVFTLIGARHGDGATLEPIREVADITRADARARDSEQLSDPRPGLRREGKHGPRHGVSDHRVARRREAHRRFAERAAAEAERVWRESPSCTIVVVADPRMLGFLRPALDRRLRGPQPYDVVELARNLSHLAPPAIHDAVARAGMLPPRGRAAPLWPAHLPRPLL